MKVRVKKLVEQAVIPQYAHATDAGMDLVSESERGANGYGSTGR